MMTQPDESLCVGEIEQLVTSRQTDYCIPSIAVDEANNSRPGAGTEMVISGNSKSVVSGINVSAHPLQNENATFQPSSMNTLPKNGLDNSIGQNISVQPSSIHVPSQMAGSGPNDSLNLNQSVQPSSIHAPPGSSLQNTIGQNYPVQPSSTNMLSYTAPPGSSGLHNSIGQNHSVQPSSTCMLSRIAPPESSGLQNSTSQNHAQPNPTHMLSYMTPQEGSGLYNSISENQSVQPNMPSHIAPAEGGNQQQIGQNQVPTTDRQPEARRSQMQNHQQSRNINKEEDNLSSSQQSHSQGSADLIRKTDGNCTSLQQSDNPGKKKVFILHSIPENSHHSGALLSFATVLRDFGINVSIDLFEQDITHDNWSMWYEREILSSKVVLCVITPDFYKSITQDYRIKGYAIYNLMGDSTKDIAFRAVFLDTPKNMEDIPLSMRGATYYCISSNDLNVPENDEFTNLYAFLTGQNRVEKPKLGKVVKLAPKKSRCKCVKFVSMIHRYS